MELLEAAATRRLADQDASSPLILLVDDNPDDRERYVRLLRRVDGVAYRYIEAEGFESMRTQLSRREADCVLLDYSLPGQNGLDILRLVMPDHPYLPVIMLTGQGNESIAVQSIKEGAQDYLVKADITPDMLHRHIASAVRHCRLQRERSHLVEALRASEETFRSVIEYATVGMGIVTAEGRWRRVNPALCHMLGFPEALLLANDVQSLLHPDDRDDALAHWERVAAGVEDSLCFACRFVGWDGRVIWGQVSLSLVRRREAEDSFIVLQLEDMTERREVDRLKNEFISVVSHELRTPLTSIRGSLGLLTGGVITGDGLPDKAKRLVQLAYDNSERLILLINDILDIDKIAAGHMRFDMEVHDLEPLIRQAVEANQPYAARYNVTLDAFLAGPFADGAPGLRVRVDATRLQQVLANLISNAAKFSPAGEAVTVRVSENGGRVVISVIDRGPGIPEAFRDRIFGRFSQADSSATRAASGTGLGLHISQQIVRHMDGEIGFDTGIGAGTTFWVSFPRVEA